MLCTRAMSLDKATRWSHTPSSNYGGAGDGVYVTASRNASKILISSLRHTLSTYLMALAIISLVPSTEPLPSSTLSSISSSSISSLPFFLFTFSSSLPPLRCDGGDVEEDDPFSSLNIPTDHLPYFLNSHPHLRDLYCSSTSSSPVCSESAESGVCWGYEPHCLDPNKRFFPPVRCEEDSRSWASTKEDQREQFFQHVSVESLGRFRLSKIVMDIDSVVKIAHREGAVSKQRKYLIHQQQITRSWVCRAFI